MKVRCIIIDDEPLALDIVAGFIKKIPALQLIDVTTDPKVGLQRILAGEADLVFLDIQMPELTGIDVLRVAGTACKFIITTAFPEYALEGYEYSVADYLVKPFSFERFEKAVSKVRVSGVTNVEHAFFFVKSEYKLIRIDFSEVIYFEALRDYVAIHLVNGQKILTLQSLSSFEKELPENLFARIHKSYILSFAKIAAIEKNRVWIGKEYFPIGDRYRDNLLKITGRIH